MFEIFGKCCRLEKNCCGFFGGPVVFNKYQKTLMVLIQKPFDSKNEVSDKSPDACRSSRYTFLFASWSIIRDLFAFSAGGVQFKACCCTQGALTYQGNMENLKMHFLVNVVTFHSHNLSKFDPTIFLMSEFCESIRDFPVCHGHHSLRKAAIRIDLELILWNCNMFSHCNFVPNQQPPQKSTLTTSPLFHKKTNANSLKYCKNIITYSHIRPFTKQPSNKLL